jgi:hypothetical protein
VGLEVLAQGRLVRVDPAVAPLDAGSVPFADASGALTEDPGRFGYTAASGLDLRRPTATDRVAGVRVVGDTQPRLEVTADGTLSWGSGGGAADVVLKRTVSGTTPHLRTVLDGVAGWQRTADTATRVWIDVINAPYSGQLQFGNGVGSADYSFVLDSATSMRVEMPATGLFRWRTAGTERVRVSTSGLEVFLSGVSQHRLAPTQIGFFGATPVGKQAVTALTDSSGGTPSDTVAAAGALYDQANENNFRASITQKVNQLRTALVNYGLVA